MKAMLFAAGLGTRLKPFTDQHPKALAQVNGKTLLEHNICYLQKAGITDVVVNVHHFADQIEDLLTKENGFGSKISISDERDEVLETGGGLKRAAHFFAGEKDIVVMNTDVLTSLDLTKMIASHQHGGAMATLAVMKRTSSRNLLFDENMRLCGWRNNTTYEEKIPAPAALMSRFAFSGIQVLTAGLVENILHEGKFSIIDVYLSLVARGKLLKGYDHTGDTFIDVGKPESLEKAAGLFF